MNPFPRRHGKPTASGFAAPGRRTTGRSGSLSVRQP